MLDCKTLMVEYIIFSEYHLVMKWHTADVRIVLAAGDD